MVFLFSFFLLEKKTHAKCILFWTQPASYLENFTFCYVIPLPESDKIAHVQISVLMSKGRGPLCLENLYCHMVVIIKILYASFKIMI